MQNFKKNTLWLAIIALCFGAIAQLLFGKHKLYYVSDYHLFVYTKETGVYTGELYFGHSLLKMDTKMEFDHRGDLPVCEIRPYNDTLFIYAQGERSFNVHNGALAIKYVDFVPDDSCIVDGQKLLLNYYYEDSIGIKSNHKPIYIEWDYEPTIWDEKKRNNKDSYRLF